MLGQGWIRTRLLPLQKGCSHQGQMRVFLDCSLGCCGTREVCVVRGEAQHPAVAAPAALNSPFTQAAGMDQRDKRAVLVLLLPEVATAPSLASAA